jgi:hypothetical protein
MNHRNLATSKPLQRVYNLMKSGGEFTTRQIIRKAHVCAINAIMPELARNGVAYKCQRRGNKWYYRLEMPLERPEVAA